jgi:hypothetical protein
MENYVHTIITPKITAFILPMVFLVVLLTIGIGIICSMKYTGISVGNGFLTVKSLFYGRKIPLDEINLEGVKSLNLHEERDKNYRITARTNGIGLPGYWVGWMILHNNHKALTYITDRTKVVLIPTKDFDILISTDDFDGIRNALSK